MKTENMKFLCALVKEINKISEFNIKIKGQLDDIEHQ
jgi:hypothetical protein